jgi:hypothetical protein
MLMQGFGRHSTMAAPERDSEVSRRYRELAREEPPRALDAEILAAAGGELETRAAPLVAPTARRRWYVPLAAAAVIVLSVVVTLALQRGQGDPELQWQEEVPAKPQAAAPQAADRAAPPAEPNAIHRSSAESVAPLLRDDLSPEDWLKRIAELRREGWHAQADEQYAAFRRRYPGYPIPQALREQVLPR